MTLPLAELATKSGDPDFLRAIAESILQMIMEADVDGLIGAGRYERDESRQTWRNGYRYRWGLPFSIVLEIQIGRAHV